MMDHKCKYEAEIAEIHSAIIGTATEPGIRDMMRSSNARLASIEADVKRHESTLHGNGGGAATGICERLRIVERVYAAGWKCAYTLSGALGMGIIAAVAAYLKGWV